MASKQDYRGKQKRLPNGLTPQQDIFAQRIAAGDTTNEAAVHAGYSPRSGYAQGNKLLKITAVREAVKLYASRVAASNHLDAAFVLNGLMRNAQTGAREEPFVDRRGEVVGTRPVDLSASNSAYGLLGKHLRLWVERTSIELGDGVRDFLNDVVRIIDDEIQDQPTRDRVTARLALLASASTGGHTDGE